MPTTTRAIEPAATVHDSSPSARQAAMPVTTAPAHATRSVTECSGGPGPVGPLDRVDEPHGPCPGATRRRSATATARQAATGTAPVADGAGPRPVVLGGGEEHRRAPVDERHQGRHGPLGHPLRRVGIGRQVHLQRDRFGRRALHLAHHQLAAVGGGGPVHPAPAVPGPVGAHAAGLADCRGGVEHAAPGGVLRPRGQGQGPTEPRPDVQRAGERRRRRSCATTAGRRVPPWRPRRRRDVHAAPLGRRVIHSVSARPTSPAGAVAERATGDRGARRRGHRAAGDRRGRGRRRSRARRVDGPDPHPGGRRRPELDGEAGGGVGGGRRRRGAGPRRPPQPARPGRPRGCRPARRRGPGPSRRRCCGPRDPTPGGRPRS